MKLLLDTHIFLWYISADKKLPLKFRNEIRNPENQAYLSIICQANTNQMTLITSDSAILQYSVAVLS